MAKNFGQKFIALQLGMLIFGALLFLGGYMLKKSLKSSKSVDVVVVEQEADL